MVYNVGFARLSVKESLVAPLTPPHTLPCSLLLLLSFPSSSYSSSSYASSSFTFLPPPSLFYSLFSVHCDVERHQIQFDFLRYFNDLFLFLFFISFSYPCFFVWSLDENEPDDDDVFINSLFFSSFIVFFLYLCVTVDIIL